MFSRVYYLRLTSGERRGPELRHVGVRGKQDLSHYRLTVNKWS